MAITNEQATQILQLSVAMFDAAPGIVLGQEMASILESGKSVEELAGQPYLYLVVADFAAPLEPRGFIIGRVDADHQPARRLFSNGEEAILPLLPGENFQVPYPPGGADIAAIDERLHIVKTKAIYDMDNYLNHYVDLRLAPAGGG